MVNELSPLFKGLKQFFLTTSTSKNLIATEMTFLDQQIINDQNKAIFKKYGVWGGPLHFKNR